MKVYVVETGSEYEDSYIVAICSTVEKAVEKVKKKLVDNDDISKDKLNKYMKTIENNPMGLLSLPYDDWIEIIEYEVDE